jgi:CAAX prenyl protease-like protein
MSTETAPARATDSNRATAAYIAPFLAFVGVMAIEKSFNLPATYFYPLRFILSLAAILIFSRGYFSLRPVSPVPSIAIGIAVFVIWIAPDQFFDYRHHWLFENSITGKAQSSLPPGLQGNTLFLILRSVSSFALVPVLEELFWRGWMMRWLINQNFLKVPLGQYAAGSFWIVALLFASEHGPYWEVGLAAGIIYNWWMIRTRSLGDCILAHAVTNAVLCVWVMATGQWQYWL